MQQNLKTLKQKYAKEEQAFERIRKMYPVLGDMSEAEILSYLQCTSKDTLVKFVAILNKTARDELSTQREQPSVCTCRDAQGKMKNLYEDKNEAERMCKFILTLESITLTMYECPTSEGWHLSKG